MDRLWSKCHPGSLFSNFTSLVSCWFTWREALQMWRDHTVCHIYEMLLLLQPFYSSLYFIWDNLGEPVPEEPFTHSYLSWSSIILICFLHLLRSMAYTLFNLCAWWYFCTSIWPFLSLLLKCHLIFLSYRPGLTSMLSTTLHTTAVQSPSYYQWYILIGKLQWYQLPIFIPSNSNSGFHSSIRISIYAQHKYEILHLKRLAVLKYLQDYIFDVACRLFSCVCIV